MYSAHNRNFAPKDRVKIMALGCFQHKIGYVKEFLGMFEEEISYDGYSYELYPKYRVAVGGYELAFCAHELQLL